jgi:cobaltochelatase CobN
LGKEPDFDLDTLSIRERDEIEQQARDWIKDEVSLTLNQTKKFEIRKQALHPTSEISRWLHETLLPRFKRCADETRSLALALEGRFVSPGPSGAPTRGRIDVLPTGRNFYSVDPRVIPTQTAWRCGQALAEELIERYRADHGEFPKHDCTRDLGNLEYAYRRR